MNLSRYRTTTSMTDELSKFTVYTPTPSLQHTDQPQSPKQRNKAYFTPKHAIMFMDRVIDPKCQTLEPPEGAHDHECADPPTDGFMNRREENTKWSSKWPSMRTEKYNVGSCAKGYFRFVGR